LAKTQPADPAPKIIKSKFVFTLYLPMRKRPSPTIEYD
jgi:hypothetical protein